MTDDAIYIQRLLETNSLRQPVLRSAVKALELPAMSLGLDAGCGMGFQCLLLADAVKPGGHVTGLDLSRDLLYYAHAVAKNANMSDRISFRRGHVNILPFDANTFDWVWSSDCIGYPVSDLLPALEELKRVLKPGGLVAILAWSSQSLLPGYPLLEAKLNATCSVLTPIVAQRPPRSLFSRSLGPFREAGLENCKAHTFASTHQAPLTGSERAGLLDTFDMLWGMRESEVSAEEWTEFQRLCQSDSDDCILDVDDYYGFFTYSMFTGNVPA